MPSRKHNKYDQLWIFLYQQSTFHFIETSVIDQTTRGRMLQSHSIISLKATKLILEYACILPFQEIKRFQFSYYVTLLLAFEVVFSCSVYLKFFYNGEAYIHIDNYDIFYIAYHLVWFIMGRLFTLSAIISLWNRSSQRELMSQIAALDARITSNLRIELTFHKLNIEFITYSIASTVYEFGYFAVEGVRNKDNWASLTYFFCCTYAVNFHFIYALYMVYWARVFLNRSDHVIDALEAATSQKHVSKSALTIIMESVKLLFDVHETIQNTFGSMLCIIVMQNSFLIAASMYRVIEIIEQNEESVYTLANQLVWFSILWMELIYIVVFFSRIGNVVSI